MTAPDLATILLVSVSLLLPLTVTAQENAGCTEGELKLMTGIPDTRPGVISGSVQYCVDGRWSIVCRTESHTVPGESEPNSEWGPREASVVCRQLGYTFNSQARNYNLNWNNPVTITCNGTENRLEECNVRIIGTCSCSRSPTATSFAVKCNTVCTDGDERLVALGGSAYREGKMEVCVNGRWRIACNSESEETLGTVCTQLGFPAEGAMFQETTSESVSGAFLCYRDNACTRPQCNSSQSFAVKCLSHKEVVGRDSFCSSNQEGDFRLSEGSSYLPNKGRVEVCVDGRWTPVCGSEPDITLAQRVCSSLGYPEENFEVITEQNLEGDISTAPCCFSSGSTACVKCENGCDQVLKVTCQTWQQVVSQALSMCTNSSNTTKTEFPDTQNEEIFTHDMSKGYCNQSRNTTIPLGSVLGAVVAVLVVSLIVMCVLWRKEVAKQREPVNLPDPDPLTFYRNQSYATHQLDNQDHIYSATTPSTPDPHSDPHSDSHSDPHSDRDSIISEQADTYDTIDQYQQHLHTPQSEPVTPTPVRDEASRREDDFYDAEEHTYSVVNKKRPKKTPEDGEGEREEPPDYEMAMTGETTWGVMDGESIQQEETT